MTLIEFGERFPYNPKLKERTRDLRKNMTVPEKKLWFGFLREVSNVKCRIYKQRPIDNFIVDFYIPKLKLVIEIDGESHFTQEGLVYDTERTAILEGLGLEVLRFSNSEIMNNFDGTCELLQNKIG